MTKSYGDKIKNRPGDGAVAIDVEVAREMILSFPDFVYPESERVGEFDCQVLLQNTRSLIAPITSSRIG